MKKDKEIFKEVIKHLKEYKVFKISIDNKGIFKDKDETLEFRNQKCNMIERILYEVLSETERKIIELKYLSEPPGKDVQIFLDLNIGANQFYALKKNALKQIATALMID